MIKKLTSILALPDEHPQRWLFALVVLATLGAIVGDIKYGMPILMAIPAGILVTWLAIVDFRKVFYLMIAAIPLSIEYAIGSFGTDLPSEPLMWVLFLTSLLWFAQHWHRVDGRFLRHPLTLALLLHLCWMLICVAVSMDFGVSIKFFLAKTWYVVVFYFLAGKLLDSERDYRWVVWSFFIPLIFTVLTVLARHAPSGFAFEETNYVMGPFYRNHVMYACVQAIFLPFLWYATYWYKRWSWPWWVLVLGIAVLLVGINFAYTRAAYVALFAAIVLNWCIRFRLMKAALVMVALVITLLVTWVTSKDNFLLFVPDFERAVTHKQFESLLEATTKLEDISVMERVYRWVAASYMIQDHPWTGFGPGNFYFFYQDYTVSSFQTYVSDNPEHSGIHCYYLMTTVEQGIPGFVIFVLFCALVMLYGERVFHQTKDLGRRRMLMAAVLSFVLIDILMFMNDFVETDKIGSFFFMDVAVLVAIDLKNRTQDASGGVG